MAAVGMPGSLLWALGEVIVDCVHDDHSQEGYEAARCGADDYGTGHLYGAGEREGCK